MNIEKTPIESEGHLIKPGKIQEILSDPERKKGFGVGIRHLLRNGSEQLASRASAITRKIEEAIKDKSPGQQHMIKSKLQLDTMEELRKSRANSINEIYETTQLPLIPQENLQKAFVELKDATLQSKTSLPDQSVVSEAIGIEIAEDDIEMFTDGIDQLSKWVTIPLILLTEDNSLRGEKADLKTGIETSLTKIASNIDLSDPQSLDRNQISKQKEDVKTGKTLEEVFKEAGVELTLGELSGHTIYANDIHWFVNDMVTKALRWTGGVSGQALSRKILIDIVDADGQAYLSVMGVAPKLEGRDKFIAEEPKLDDQSGWGPYLERLYFDTTENADYGIWFNQSTPQGENAHSVRLPLPQQDISES